MPELDMNTLFWVLSKDCELNHKIFDLRVAIQDEIQKQLDKQSDVKEEINIHG